MSFDTHNEISPEPNDLLVPTIVSGDTYEDRFKVSKRGSSPRRFSKPKNSWNEKSDEHSFAAPRKFRNRVSVDYDDSVLDEAATSHDKRLQSSNKDYGLSENSNFHTSDSASQEDAADRNQIQQNTPYDNIASSQDSNTLNRRSQIEKAGSSTNTQRRRVSGNTKNSSQMTIDDIVPKEDSARRPRRFSRRSKVQDVEPIHEEVDNPQELEKFRSAGLDSLFSSTSDSRNDFSNQANVESANGFADVAANNYNGQINHEDGNQYGGKALNGTVHATKPEGSAQVLANADKESTSSMRGLDTSASLINTSISGATEANINANKGNQFSNSDSMSNNTKDIAASGWSTIQQSNRKVIIVCPSGYDCVKEVADALNSNNVLALSLANINEQDRVRILDFAFGAASMTGARVSVEGKQLFIFTKDYPITNEERVYCQQHGIDINKE